MSRETIIFDQYSRYRSCADVLEAAGAGLGPGAGLGSNRGGTILDVGSGPERLLGRFLPDREITYLDPLLGKLSSEDRRGVERIITESFLDHDFEGEQFDFVVAVDTLEHIPPEDREAFIGRMNEVAREGVVVACPCGDVGAATDTDKQVNAVYRRARERDYPWLSEHLAYGLPRRRTVVRQLEKLGHHVRVVGNGHGPWLRELLPLVLCLLDHANARPVIDALSRRFNEALYPYDHFPPCYRQIILATRGDADSLPEWREPTSEQRKKAKAAWDELHQIIISEVAGLIGRLSSQAAPFDLIHHQLQDLTHELHTQLSAGQEAVRQVEERAALLSGEKAALIDSVRNSEEVRRHGEEQLAVERERSSALDGEKAELTVSLRDTQEAKKNLEEQLAAERERSSALDGEKAELTVSLRDIQEVKKNLEEQLAAERERSVVLEGEKTGLADKLRRHHDAGRFLERKLVEVEGSRSWRWTKPLRWMSGTQRDLRKGLHRRLGRMVTGTGLFVYHNLPLPSGVRWRCTVAYCECFRPILRQTSTWDTYARERRWRASRNGTTKASTSNPPALELDRSSGSDENTEDPSLPMVIVWGVIDWHFRIQRPQHLARELAKRGHRVLYVSPHFVDDPEPGFAAERLGGEGDIRIVRLHARGRLVIYEGAFAEATLEQLRLSVALMLLWAGEAEVVSIVDHPTWHALARMIPNSRVVYDCMDNHHGFAESGDGLGAMERELIRESDLVFTSSRWLESMARKYTDRVTLIRNGCEFEHFARKPNDPFHDSGGRRIIGYIGAMAEWFDAALVRKVAERFPERHILLIGADTAGVGTALSECPNVQFTGEIPYAELPGYLHAMDVCLIPFVINGLTEATNPVKVYEYLAAGKPVVTTDLPEMREPELDELIYRAESHDLFLERLGTALEEPSGAPIRNRRREFAEGQTWTHRGRELDRALAAMDDPFVSIVVVTHNNLELTKHCLQSIQDDGYPHLEIIVVDNASTDGTPAWLRKQERRFDEIRVILNEDNRGFGAANNQGLAVAGGEYLILLNNDTVVTRGWLRTLVNHLRRDPSIGIIGPVTNNIGNEARIETSYSDLEDLPAEAFAYTRRQLGRGFDLEVLAFFCVAFSRSTYETVGELDEQFGMGFFEDDDYCRRIRNAGGRVVCAEDAYVHHELSASFSRVSNGERKLLFEKNRGYFESKWGPWTPHRYRETVGSEKS